MNVDIPIHVETIQVTNPTTRVSALRVVTPHFEMNFGGGTQPFFLDEFVNTQVSTARGSTQIAGSIDFQTFTKSSRV
jgi:hypothetical protein